MLRFVLSASALAATQAQQHSWSWFYENMCGCTMTHDEGCGMSSSQLYKLMTESPSLKMCEETETNGDAEKTSHWRDPEDEKMKIRVIKECKAKLKLKALAEDYKGCHDLSTKDACDSKPDTCEWEAQDEKACGIDEEKLIAKFVGEKHKDHPLVANILLQDRCSMKAFDACNEDVQCAYLHSHKKCVANNGVMYNAFLEHPALFQVLDIERRGAVCQAWSDHVWQGEICWNEECHWERGLCNSNVKMKEKDVTRESIMRMRKDLCNARFSDTFGGSRTVGGVVETCPPTCHVDKKSGSCEPDDIDDSKSLELTDADEEVAMYFEIMRGATLIQEIRCNSLDGDDNQCRSSASEHLDCPAGHFHPKPAGEEKHPGFVLRHNSHTASDASMSTTDKPSEEIDPIKNAMDHLPDPDGGIGFQGPLGDLIKNAGLADKAAFMQSFGSMLSDPETMETLKMMQQKVPDAVQGFSQFWNEIKGPEAETTVPPPPPPQVGSDGEGTFHSQTVLVCIICLLLAGIFGGFAWGVLCSNKTGRNGNHQMLLETQYVRHQEPGLRNV